jgi:hypothetical protein
MDFSPMYSNHYEKPNADRQDIERQRYNVWLATNTLKAALSFKYPNIVSNQTNLDPVSVNSTKQLPENARIVKRAVQQEHQVLSEQDQQILAANRALDEVYMLQEEPKLPDQLNHFPLEGDS